MFFSDCHPSVNFIFYIAAIGLGMCFSHPLFLLCAFLLSVSYYWILKKNVGRYLLRMVFVFAAISLINPIFSTYGETVLFSCFRGRPYTFEALCYGISIGAMFATIMTWFASYNEVMTSDKFLYCFGKLAPAVSLILTMVFRLVPSFQKKIEQIASARRCIGMSVKNGTKSEKIEHGMTIVSALTSWALEGGVVMADSMRSRGYGCGKRTSFSIYKFRKSDRSLLCIMSILIALIIVCAWKGGMRVEFFPCISMKGLDNIWTSLGVGAYVMFLSIPTVLHILEEITWRILKSKI